MEDAEVQLVLLNCICPRCSGNKIFSFEDADDSMQFDCFTCDWTGTASEEQILKCVALASQFPEV